MIGSVQIEEERTLLEKLTWLLTGIANGKLPDVVQDTARCTQGVAIPKKDGKPRSLRMRETLVNLATKTLLQTVKDRIMTTFDGVNYALAGKKKMDELIALMRNAMLTRPDHDRLFIDAKNAFNECRRDKAAESILEHCPELGALFFALYGSDTKVWLRAEHDDWTIFLAQEGAIQGCVLGEPLDNNTWDQIRLPVKLHGFGLGHVDDTISAAYVANVLETRKAVRDLLPSAAYLDHLDDEPDAASAAAAVRLGSRESKIEEYVEVFRAHKQKIVDTATRADVDILDKWQSCLDERKLQFLFSRASYLQFFFKLR